MPGRHIRSPDCRRLLSTKRPLRNLGNSGGERRFLPNTVNRLVHRAGQAVLRFSVKGAYEQPRHITARMNTFLGGVRRSRTVGRAGDCFTRVIGVEQRARRQAHERTVSCRVRIRRAAKRLPCFDEPLQRCARRVTDIETVAGAAQVSVAPPAGVPFKLIDRIERSALNQALGQTQRHGRIVRPLTRLQSERAAAGNVRNGGEAGGTLEFKGCSERIAGGKPQQCASCPTFPVRMHVSSSP